MILEHIFFLLARLLKFKSFALKTIQTVYFLLMTIITNINYP